MTINLVDLKERVATSKSVEEDFSPEERDYILRAINRSISIDREREQHALWRGERFADRVVMRVLDALDGPTGPPS